MTQVIAMTQRFVDDMVALPRVHRWIGGRRLLGS